jgi:hypothetical protein
MKTKGNTRLARGIGRILRRYTHPGILVKSVDLLDYKGVEFCGSDKDRQRVRNFLRQKELVARGKLGLTGNSDARQLVEIQKLGTVGVRILMAETEVKG